MTSGASVRFMGLAVVAALGAVALGWFAYVVLLQAFLERAQNGMVIEPAWLAAPVFCGAIGLSSAWAGFVRPGSEPSPGLDALLGALIGALLIAGWALRLLASGSAFNELLPPGSYIPVLTATSGALLGGRLRARLLG